MHIAVPEDMWDDVSPEADRSRLLTTIVINSCPMHLEAVEILEGDKRTITTDYYPQQEFANAPDWIAAAIAESADWESVQTCEIGGRRYALIATPYQR